MNRKPAGKFRSDMDRAFPRPQSLNRQAPQEALAWPPIQPQARTGITELVTLFTICSLLFIQSRYTKLLLLAHHAQRVVAVGDPSQNPLVFSGHLKDEFRVRTVFRAVVSHVMFNLKRHAPAVYDNL